MAFKRKESAIPIKTKAYKYRIFPEYQKMDFPEEIKAGIFREARLMNELWNQLIEIRRATLDALTLIYDESAALYSPGSGDEQRKKISSKDLKKLAPEYQAESDLLWKDYELKIKALAADAGIRAKINWETREDVFNRFETAHKQALKDGGDLKFISGYIQQFHFTHRFSGGGLEAAAIHRPGRSKKLYVAGVGEEAFESESYRNRLQRVVSGRFGAGIGDALQIPFRIVLHRRLPKEAKIKTAVLTGKFKNRRWEYNLVLTVDQPLEIADRVTTGNVVAGLDLGWRKFEDYIRFGVLADSDGNTFEFRLPVNPGKKQSHRRLEKMLAKHGHQLPEYPQTWQDIEDWQTKNDLSTERVKELIRAADLPDTKTIKPIIDNLVRVRKSGLLRLLRALEEINGDEPENVEAPVPKVIEILTGWRDEYFSRENSINYTRDRLINNRNYNYQLLANWLKNNYTEIAYEGDLQLQQIAEKAANASLLEENGAILKNSAKFRTRVGLYELLRRIKQKQEKGENWLKPKKSAYTSTTCLRCGGICRRTVNLMIACENGHEQDQDVQVATNLRNELADDFTGSAKRIIIPEKLKNIIVPMKF